MSTLRTSLLHRCHRVIPSCHHRMYTTTSTRHQQTQTQRQRRAVPLDPRIAASYNILEINSDATMTEIRHSYFQLAKKLHPDSIDNTTADATRDATTKFAAVFNAYETLRKHKAETDDQNDMNDWLQFADDVKQHNAQQSTSAWQQNQTVSHKLPQSRHYLGNEGVGFGPSPFERNKQYNTHKVERAIDNVGDYNMYKLEQQVNASLKEQADQHARQQQSQNTGNNLRQHNISSTDVLNLIKTLEQHTDDRVVGKKSKTLRLDEAIKSSMTDWDCSEYKGKKLNVQTIDTGDPLTNKLNSILSRNGIVPEWLRIEQQIERNYVAARDQLRWHHDHIQYADDDVIRSEIEAEIAQRLKEQTEADEAWELARKQGKSRSQVFIKQLANELLNDRYGSSATYNTVQQTYLYHDHQHDTSEEHSNCMKCVQWKRAITLASHDLKRVARMTDTFNLTVPSTSRQRMHYLLQNLIAEVVARPPQAQLAEYDRAEYSSQYRVYPRDVEESLDDSAYYNRQQYESFGKAAYHKPMLHAAMLATAGVMIFSVGTATTVVKFAKQHKQLVHA